jgi:hypothetical protein
MIKTLTIVGVCIIVALALAACATPQTLTVTKTVKVPVSVPCRVTLPAAPVFALSACKVTDPLFVKARAAIVEINQRKAYEAQIIGAAKACE